MSYTQPGQTDLQHRQQDNQKHIQTIQTDKHTYIQGEIHTYIKHTERQTDEQRPNIYIHTERQRDHTDNPNVHSYIHTYRQTDR